MQPHRWQHLVKPKHELRLEKSKLVRVHAGFFEERDVQGTFVHWTWLTAKWTALADKIEGEERRGVYGPKNSTQNDLT
jgi:hypothetical protein